MSHKLLAALLFTALIPAAALAQGKPDSKAEATKEKSADIPPPSVSVTKHKGNFGGKAISYTATTGETYLTDEKGKPTAAIRATMATTTKASIRVNPRADGGKKEGEGMVILSV